MAARRRTRKPSHSARKPATPAAWYRDLNRDQIRDAAGRYARARVAAGVWSPDEASEKASDYAIRLQAEARARELDYLNQAVKQLRHYAQGFGAGDGYNLKEIATWPKARTNKVRSYAEALRGRLARPHADTLASKYREPKRQRQFKRALAIETGLPEKEWRRFPVQVHPTKRKTRVALTDDGGIEKRDYIAPGEYIVKREWRFADFIGKQPETRAEFIAAMKAIAAQLPKGERFRMFTRNHGQIGTMFSKETALDEMRLYYDEYISSRQHPGFGDLLLGVSFFSQKRDTGMKRQAAEDRKRARAQAMKSKQTLIARRRQRFLAGQLARLRKIELQVQARRKPRGKK